MSAGALAAPGTEYGPCLGPCDHSDCAETRRMAEQPCRLCGEPSGYDRPLYRDPAGRPGMFVHARCLEAAR